ncbi:TadE/TadG family type IV pilus assembly protein [Nocardioides sp. YIM B13467]|uniref:TadE/TadG family type IV pilus assembly protein n=1 Tax=Nocardioides sp. YIM B13467 TaxID=3366294 RepID=UPI00366F476D
MTARARDERGSAAIEAAIGLPAFLLFVGLIIAGGRLAVAHQALQSAAADGARAASIARDASDAESSAWREATTSLSNQNLRCRATQVTVDTSGFRVPTGQPANVTVTLMCRVDLADLSVPGIPGSRLLRTTMSSPIDTWRERGLP